MDTNVFRFKSFTEHINEIDLRRQAFYYVGHNAEDLTEDNDTSYFHQVLNKWMLLNLTEEFGYFSKRCRQIITLPQLLHKKDYVIDLILERLEEASVLSQQPLLELLPVFARDIREHFFPYFQRVLDRLICMLNTQNNEQLEWTLICLAHLFKNLKPILKRNIGFVFNAILPLLNPENYPDHITAFATECMAYVARDVRDFEQFLSFILQTIQNEQVEIVKGCGFLLFHIFRGVNGQLHTCTTDLLPHVLEVMSNKDSRYTSRQMELMTNILENTFMLLLNFLTQGQTVVLWQQICAAILKEDLNENATRFIDVMLVLVTYKKGYHISEETLVATTLVQLLKRYKEEPEIFEKLGMLVSNFLIVTQVHLDQLNSNRLITNLLGISDVSRFVYEHLILKLLDYKKFELLVLPHVVAYYETHLDMSALELLGEIVQSKQPLSIDTASLENWQVYPIKLRLQATFKHIEKIINELDIKDEHHLLLIFLSPHFCGFSKEALLNSLNNTMQSLQNCNTSNSSLMLLLLQIYKLLDFTLPQCLLSKLHENLLLGVADDIKSLACLELLLIQRCPKSELFLKTVATISPLLSKPQMQYRRISAHCLAMLGSHLTKGTSNPYSTFYEVSRINPTVQNYRDLLLQLLPLETSAAHLDKLTDYNTHIVYLLLGLLYHNFKLVWAPLQDLLVEYGKHMKTEQFWPLFEAKLTETSVYIKQSMDMADMPKCQVKEKSYTSSILVKVLSSYAPKDGEIPLEHAFNYRKLLWQCIPKLSNINEKQIADLVRSFLLFLKFEYHTYIEKEENTWDLHEEEAYNHIHTEEDNESSNHLVIYKKKGRRKRNVQNVPVKFILETLQLKLACFVSKPCPKALESETNMRDIYFEFLANSNGKLQELALECLAAYKQPVALVKYKIQLKAIIDEKSFKETMTTFDLESVALAQRTELMPYLLRVLYGKMFSKGVQSQLNSQQRKTHVLRFMGQFTEEEIQEFLKMAFGRYENYTQQPVDQIVTFTQLEFSPTAAISARQLQRIVNLLEIIRKEFACRLTDDFQVYVLKLILFVGCVCQQVLNCSPEVAVVYKNVKHAALQTLVNYFAQLHDMANLWQRDLLLAICQVYVWPDLYRLHNESIHSPTPLLKLLLLWAEPRYQYCFLLRPSPDAENIMHELMALLLNDKAKPAVHRALWQMIKQLLESMEMDEYGSAAKETLQPHIPTIIQRMQTNWSQRHVSSKQSIDKFELSILTLLTSHVQDSDVCELLLKLLLPIFTKQMSVSSSSSDLAAQLIETLTNVFKNVPSPHLYIGQLAPLFEVVQDLPARKLLCELLKSTHKRLCFEAKTTTVLTSTIEAFKLQTHIVMMLNAWDKRRLEQPDYDQRLRALVQLKQITNEGEVDLNLGVLVIYNCFYMLRFDSDQGIHMNIVELLKLLVPHLIKQTANKKQLSYLLDGVLFPILQRCIQDENKRNLCDYALSLLSTLVAETASAHPILQDLSPLADKNDAEIDFFQNIQHLQSRQHIRALQRICNISASCWHRKPPSVRTLTQFLLPLTTRYLLKEKYVGNHVLIDTAINALSAMCELLPWQHYHSILRHYLQKLQHVPAFQKQCVRIVMRVLDSFHFNLKQSQENTSNDHKDPKGTEEKEEVQGTQDKAIQRAINDDEDEIELKDELNLLSEHSHELQQRQELSSEATNRIITTITKVLLPTLNRAIAMRADYEAKHKVNRRRLSYEREEEETQRVPIALAMVKLLQKLPKQHLDDNLPGIFMKVCNFLRSPLKSVRILTRDILKKIMLTLGSKYLELLIEQLQSLLTRGFQVHVLSVTLHEVLNALRDQLEPSHIEQCLHNLLDVVLNDIFGDTNNQKEVAKIIARTPEATPSSKSYLILYIAARNIRENCLLDLLLPFKEYLLNTHSRKVTQKVQECYSKIIVGIAENVNIKCSSLLVFIYGIISENITDLLPDTQKNELKNNEHLRTLRRACPDYLLLQPLPSRRSVACSKEQLKSNHRANAHILIELGLELLHFVLRRKKLAELENYESFVQPFITLLLDALYTTYGRTTTYALKCFTALWLGEYKLQGLGVQETKKIVERIFEILKNFSTFGATRQEENALLVRVCLKAIVALLLKSLEYAFSDEQVEQLLLHIEKELYGDECSSKTMWFPLLKALVGRKINSRSLHDLIRRVSELSITSQIDYVREKSHDIILKYVMEYEDHNKVEQIIKLMSVQLSYTQPAGRKTAIRFIQTIINKFPNKLLQKYSEFLYLTLGTRLINDEDVSCKHDVAIAIEALIGRLSKAERDSVFELTMIFITSPASKDKANFREMGACLMSRFVQAEGSEFAHRLPMVLQTLVEMLTCTDLEAPGRFVRAPGQETTNLIEREEKTAHNRKKMYGIPGEILILAGSDTKSDVPLQKQLDHQLIQLEHCLIKIFERFGKDLMGNKMLAHVIDELAYSCQRLLAHEHNWVRCNAIKLLGHILAHYDYVFVAQKLIGVSQTIDNSMGITFIYTQPKNDIKSLVLDLCAQIIPDEVEQSILDEIVKIFLYVGHMLKDVPFTLKRMAHDHSTEVSSGQLDFIWLLRNMSFLVNKEVAKAPHSKNIRTAVFNLIEAFISLLSSSVIMRLAPTLLQMLVREMSEEDQNVNAEVRQQALRVGKCLRARIGSEEYDKLQNTIKSNLLVRRVKRRKVLTQEKIHDPARAAKRKASVQERKKIAKRLKKAVVHGKAADIKHKLKNRERKIKMTM